MNSIDADLEQAITGLRARLTPPLVEAAVRELLRQGEDPGGGVGAHRLVRYLLGEPGAGDERVRTAYERLKPGLGAALEEIPSLYFFEGD